MRRFVRFIAGLYPRAWRKRYGGEFEALLDDVLLNDVNPSFATVVNVLRGAIAMQMRTWSFSRMLAISVLCGGVAFAVMLYFVPHGYMSTAVVRLTGLASEQSRIDYVSGVYKETMSRQVLTNVINAYDLYPRQRSRVPMQEVIAQMQRHVHAQLLASDSDKTVFSLGFDYPDGRTAQKVVDKLTSRFLAPRDSQVTLQVLDSANLPTESQRSVLKLAMMSALISGIGLAILALLRWRSLKKA